MSDSDQSVGASRDGSEPGPEDTFDATAAAQALERLHADWELDESATRITRRFEFKGYAKAVYLSHLVVWLADRDDHHPDVSFGWGYCTVSWTSHDVGGLSQRDIDAAAELDRLVDRS